MDARTNRARLLQGSSRALYAERRQESLRMKKTRRCRGDAVSARLELVELLVEKEEREELGTPARLLAFFTPLGIVSALYDAASARRLETPGRPGGDT